MVASEMINQISYSSLGMELAGGPAGDPLALLGGIQAQLKNDLLDEHSELSKALEAFQMPSVIVGTKVTEGAENVIAKLDAIEIELPPFFIVSDIKVGAAAFKSWSVNLQDLVSEGMVAELNEFLEERISSRALDEPAEGIAKHILSKGLGVLTERQQHVYKKFILGLLVAAIFIVVYFLLNYWSIKFFMRFMVALTIFKIIVPLTTCFVIVPKTPMSPGDVNVKRTVCDDAEGPVEMATAARSVIIAGVVSM